MSARLFQAAGVTLILVSLLANVFDIPLGVPRTVLAIVLVGGVLCLVASLVLERMGRP